MHIRFGSARAIVALELALWTAAVALLAGGRVAVWAGVLVFALALRGIAVVVARRREPGERTPEVEPEVEPEPEPGARSRVEIGGLASELRDASTALAKSAAALQESSRAQTEAVEKQAAATLAFRDMFTKLSDAAAEIERTAAEVQTNAEQTLATTTVMADELRRLNAESGSIRELLELIRGVADRSDILALNGSLEATRAGEAGRGFALVAAEMRRLAENVTRAAQTVRESVANIDAAGASTVEATERSRALATATAGAARRISTIAQAQSEDAVAVSAEVFNIGQLVTETVWAMNRTETATAELVREVAKLERIHRQFEALEHGPD